MPVPIRLITHQKQTISSLLRLALSSGGASIPDDIFERQESIVLPPRPNALIDAYIHHLGIEPAHYEDTVPAHLFAQWSFAPIIRAIQGAPYTLRRALNGGCRLEINAPIPRDEPLQVRSRLMEIDDNGRRALLRIEVITGTESAPDALRAEPYLIIPLPTKEKRDRERPIVSPTAELLERWQIPAHAGREFAVLTGDINPIHSLLPFARLAGFKGCILHGFSSLARATESILRARAGGDPGALRSIDAKFTKAIVLPNNIGIFADGDGQFFVGHEAGGPAYVTGSFHLHNGNKQ
jgi:hypothetical protein